MTLGRVLVVGAGQMGSGIAQVVAASGRQVLLLDAAPGAVDRGQVLDLAAFISSAGGGGGAGGSGRRRQVHRCSRAWGAAPATCSPRRARREPRGRTST